MEWLLLLAAVCVALGSGIALTYLILRPRMIATQELDAQTAKENEELKSTNIRL
jgi:hypothetical protein